jgi:copper chaperone
MLDFQVEGMTCGHCEKAVIRAVRTVDPDARVTVGRSEDRVAVDSAADPDPVRRAIEAEGYAASRRD